MPETLIPPAPATNPADLSFEELLQVALFHGTAETIEGALGTGPDGVLWTSPSPAVAQTYIPRAGLSAVWGYHERDANDPVSPGEASTDLLLARQLGYACVIHETDGRGRPASWSWRCPEGRSWPKRGDLAAYVTDVLGYEPWRTGIYQLTTRIQDGEERILPASYRLPGELYIVLPTAPLRCYDASGGGEGDLMDPDHRRYGLFRQLAAEGWDAVRIADFAQSPSEGNVPHPSIGVLPAGLAKITATSVPATHFDCGMDTRVRPTPDLEAGHRALVRRRPRARQR